MTDRREGWKQKIPRVVLLGGLFLLVSLGCHAAFLGSDGMWFFVWGKSDAGAQMLPFQYLLTNNWDSGNFFWSWEYGLGGDLFNEFSFYYSTSPVFILFFLLRKITGADFSSLDGLLYGRLLLSILQQTASMIFMYLLLRYETNVVSRLKTKNRWPDVIGAVLYGTAACFLTRSILFDFMVNSMVWLPLVCLGLRRYDQEKKPCLYIVSFGLMIMNSFYFGYMSCIFIGTFILVMNVNIRDMRGTVRRLLEKLVLTILGFGVGAVGFLPSLYAFAHADRHGVDVESGFLPQFSQLVEKISLSFTHWQSISVCVLAIVGYILVRSQKDAGDEGGRKRSYLALFWFLLYLSPIASSAMNGFSYETDRWYYIFVFSLAYAVPVWLRRILAFGRLRRKNGTLRVRNLLSILITVLFVAGVIFTNASLGKYETNVWERVCGGCGVLTLLFLAAAETGFFRRWKRAASFVLTVIVAFNAVAFNAAYVEYWSGQKILVSKQVPAEETLMLDGAFDPSFLYEADDSFYRISNKAVEATSNRQENVSNYTGTRGLSAYNSLISETLQTWYRDTHNVYLRYITPSYYNGFDSRLFLENAWGVKYVVHSDGKPYGYTEELDPDGNTYYVNQNAVGIDLWYDTWIDEQEFQTLNVAERDAALLQTAVLTENAEENWGAPAVLDGTVTEVSLDWEHAVYTNCTLSGQTLNVPRLDETDTIESAECGVITIPIRGEVSGEGEYLLTLNVTATADKGLYSPCSFKLTANDHTVYKYDASYNWAYPMDSYTFRLDKSIEFVELSLTPGEYEINNAALYFSSYDSLADWTSDRNRYNLTDLTTEKNTVRGSIANSEAGLLALNIPYSEGWSCKMDGKNHTILPVNGTFTGIQLPAGEHVVELTYFPPMLKAGMAVSVISVLICLGLLGYTVRERRTGTPGRWTL